MGDTGYWYCSNCREEVGAYHVTNKELHEACGHTVTWIEPTSAEEAIRARVAELEKERDAFQKKLCEEDSSPCLVFRQLKARECDLDAAESRASAAVEAHAQLLSRIAADGTLDAMERAAAAEQRVKRLEVELAGVCGAAESLLSQDSSAVDIERLRVRVREARAALAASEAEAPARCRCGHDASQHYDDSEARGRPCRECGCLGMESDEAPARDVKCPRCCGHGETVWDDTRVVRCGSCGGTGKAREGGLEEETR